MENLAAVEDKCAVVVAVVVVVAGVVVVVVVVVVLAIGLLVNKLLWCWTLSMVVLVQRTLIAPILVLGEVLDDMETPDGLDWCC